MMTCRACKKELSPGREVGRKDECPFCRADLHCCLNCKFYDRAAPKQCREPVVELVRDKEKANFCDYFEFADRPSPGTAGAEPERVRKALGDLFKK